MNLPNPISADYQVPRAQRIAEAIAEDVMNAVWGHYWSFSIHEPALKRALVRVLAMGLSHGKPLEESLTDVEVRTIDQMEGSAEWRRGTEYEHIA